MAKIVRRMLILKENIKYVPKEVRMGGVVETVLVEDCKLTHLDITGDDNFGRVALSILKERFGNPEKAERLKLPKPPNCPISKAAWVAMKPEDEGYAQAEAIVEASIQDRANYENSLKTHAAVMRCIENQDIRLAPALVESRRHYPNEGYEIAALYDEFF